MKNFMEYTNAHFIHWSLPSMGCEMDYVDSDNIPVASSWTKNVVDVNIVRGIFPEEAGHVAPVNTAS
jgi:hypothetical protein